MFLYIYLVILLGSAVVGRDLTDEEYYSLPELFHLDDYEKCLAHDEGVYCLGTFHLSPLEEASPVFELIKEYTKETYAFNRTLIHRGYCISSRCPELNSTHLSNFENCTAKMLNKYSLRTNLTVLQYCRTRADTQRQEGPSIPQIAYLIIVIFLLVMNVIGTVYDVRTGDNPQRSRIPLAWSAIANWELLTSSMNKDQLPLTALNGIRVLVSFMICFGHSALLFFSLYLQQPRALENVAAHPVSMFLQNSTGPEQMFVVISGFLYAYYHRIYSEKNDITFSQIPLIIAKRVVRLSPVFILVVGFAATWWPALGSGPVWSATVGAESEICKNKFWTHLLFVNNLVQADTLCVLPSWYLAVDMQMHILTTFIMVFLQRFPRRMLLTLGLLFGASCILNAVLVYIFDWVPMLYLCVSPENLRTLFRDAPTFTGLYISPWGSLSACLLGLFLGYVYYDNKDEKFVMGRYKWLLYTSFIMSIPLLTMWMLIGYFVQHIKAKAFMVAYAALERSIFLILTFLSYVVCSVVSGFLIKLLAWRGWHAMSRMSLSVLMLHWIVNLCLVGSSPQPLTASILDVVIYGVATAVITYIVAVPVTLLVEIPIKKFFDVIFVGS